MLKLPEPRDRFEWFNEPIDVTSIHRPDTAWKFTDSSGHVHQWWSGGKPATDYRPLDKYETPSLVWVKDGEEYWPDDDEPHDVGHHECIDCHESVEPKYTADTYRQYVPGLSSYRINGIDVTREEYERRFKEAYGC